VQSAAQGAGGDSDDARAQPVEERFSSRIRGNGRGRELSLSRALAARRGALKRRALSVLDSRPNCEHLRFLMRELFTWEQAQSLINTAVEVADLDFKEAAPNLTDIEAAKDIAALANTLGGHIVVGAQTSEGRTRCTGLRGIDAGDATLAQQRYESGAQRIRPSVQIATRQLAVPNTQRALVIVEVAAAHAAPVGLQLQEFQGQPLVGKGWVFPYRVGSQTNFFSPDQFSAFNDMSARRAAALLSSIPQTDRDKISLRADAGMINAPTHHDTSTQKFRRDSLGAIFEEVDLQKNVAVFRASLQPADALHPLRIPLDWVATAWRDDQQNKWIIMTACRFFHTGEQWIPIR
jgi:hypothetical protein